jgi:hypothetical protein
MNRLLPLCVLVFVGMQASLSFAAGEHKHEAKTFATVAAGLTALDAAVVNAKTKAAAGDFEALHDISEDLHGIADGLKKRLPDVAAENRDRFKFNVDQVNALHEQLEAAHESKKAEDVNRVIKRLEDVAGRLKTLTPAK